MTREEALKKMQEVKAYMTAGNPIWSVTVIGEAFDMAIEALEAEERKTGEWIEENRRPKSMMFYCSECHRTAYDPQNHHGGMKRCRYAFCPNCGARMKGETDEID